MHYILEKPQRKENLKMVEDPRHNEIYIKGLGWVNPNEDDSETFEKTKPHRTKEEIKERKRKNFWVFRSCFSDFIDFIDFFSPF